MTHDVFISYSNRDKPIADGICANLETAGVRCWIAPRDIAPGEDWPTAITRAITHSRVMVLVFSAHSNSSEDVSRELFLAANSKLVIIPFKIDNIEPEPGKQYYLARTHWLDAINPPTQEQIHALIDCVKTVIPLHGNPKIETPPPMPDTAPRKNMGIGRLLWIPAALVLLGLFGWGVLTWGANTFFAPKFVPTQVVIPSKTTIPTASPVLSAAEKTQTACSSLTVCKQVEIKAVGGWQPFATPIQKGEHVRIVYISGKWAAHPGAAMDPYTPGSGGFYIPQISANALVARIGEYSTAFMVGRNVPFQANSSGILYLSINDNDMHDNFGSIIVLIEAW
jgi:hypothetical protein